MTPDPASIDEIATSWMAACKAFDNDRILEHVSADATIWFNFQLVDHDRAGYRKMLDDAAGYIANRHYEDLRVQRHANGFLEQATLVGEINGKTARTPFLLVATVADGKICRIEEYFDTTIVNEASKADE